MAAPVGARGVGARGLRLGAQGCFLGAIELEGRGAAARRRRGLARRGRWRRRDRRRARVGIANVGERLFDGQQFSGLHQPDQPDLQMEARLQRGLEVAEEVERKLQIAGEILFGKLPGDFGQLCALRAEAAMRRALSPPRDPRHQQIAEVAGQFAAKCCRFRPLRSSSSTTSSMRRESPAARARRDFFRATRGRTRPAAPGPRRG